MDKKLQVVPLGGLGEFGMNCLALRYGDDIIVLDAGMMFPDAELLGVDIVTPDFSYLKQNSQHVRGLILTHGHEDHIGGVPHVWPHFDGPVYGSKMALALIERKWHTHENFADCIESDYDVRRWTVLISIITQDAFDNWLDIFRWNEIVAALDNHCKDLCDFVLLM